MDRGHICRHLPFGFYRISWEDSFITGIRHLDGAEPDEGHSLIAEEAEKELSEYMEGKRRSFSFPMLLRGTSFRMKVWNALLSVPYGETVSYRELAERTGSPGAARAVGTALRLNPLQIAYPCHRVVPSSGGTGRYAGGVGVKKMLLELEKGSRVL